MQPGKPIRRVKDKALGDAVPVVPSKRRKDVDAEVYGNWIPNVPQVKAHYRLHANNANLVTFGADEVFVFDLTKPSDVKKFNTIIRRGTLLPDSDGPAWTLSSMEKAIVGDRWLVYCQVKHILYRQFTTH